MTDEKQSEPQWAPRGQATSNRWRIWLIVGLIVAGLVVAAVLVFLLVSRDEAPGATETPSPSATSSPTDSGSPSAEPEPSMTPITTQPSADAPSEEAFRAQVGFWLDDAARGLDIVADSNGPDATAVLQTLKEDAQRMSDAQPPSSIAENWASDLSAYAQSLADLQSAVSSGSGLSATLETARSRVQTLSALIGL